MTHVTILQTVGEACGLIAVPLTVAAVVVAAVAFGSRKDRASLTVCVASLVLLAVAMVAR